MTTLKLVVLAKNQAELRDFQLEHVLGVVDELVLIANDGARFGGLGAIGNHAIESSRCDVVGLVHADAVLGPGAVEAFAREAFSGSVAGMVGRNLAGHYVWCRDIERPMDVSTLDSCCCFFRRDTLVRFDTRNFDNFHCCVEDFCLTAAYNQIPVRVPPAPGCDHLGTNWQKPDWMADYHRYRQLLEEKWDGVEFRTT